MHLGWWILTVIFVRLCVVGKGEFSLCFTSSLRAPLSRKCPGCVSVADKWQWALLFTQRSATDLQPSGSSRCSCGGSAARRKRPTNESWETCESDSRSAETDSSQWAKKLPTFHFISPESQSGSARSWRVASCAREWGKVWNEGGRERILGRSREVFARTRLLS